jgi:hypothetical protein
MADMVEAGTPSITPPETPTVNGQGEVAPPNDQSATLEAVADANGGADLFQAAEGGSEQKEHLKPDLERNAIELSDRMLVFLAQKFKNEPRKELPEGIQHVLGYASLKEAFTRQKGDGPIKELNLTIGDGRHFVVNLNGSTSKIKELVEIDFERSLVKVTLDNGGETLVPTQLLLSMQIADIADSEECVRALSENYGRVAPEVVAIAGMQLQVTHLDKGEKETMQKKIDERIDKIDGGSFQELTKNVPGIDKNTLLDMARRFQSRLDASDHQKFGEILTRVSNGEWFSSGEDITQIVSLIIGDGEEILGQITSESEQLSAAIARLQQAGGTTEQGAITLENSKKRLAVLTNLSSMIREFKNNPQDSQLGRQLHCLADGSVHPEVAKSFHDFIEKTSNPRAIIEAVAASKEHQQLFQETQGSGMTEEQKRKYKEFLIKYGTIAGLVLLQMLLEELRRNKD